MAQELPVGMDCVELYEVPTLCAFFPYLEAALDLHRRAKGTGFGGNVGIVDQMKLSIKSVLKTYAPERFGNDKGDHRTPFGRMIKELDRQGTYAAKGGIADYENVLEIWWRCILKEVFS